MRTGLRQHLSLVAQAKARAIALAAAAFLIGSGCAGATAEGPISVDPGLQRAEAIRALRAHDFCRPSVPDGEREIYPRCDRPGTELGASWVVAEYHEDVLQRVQRFERYDDDAAAVDRWQDLVTRRTSLDGPPSPEARANLIRQRGLPRGTRSWAAFARRGSQVLVGIYLLTPQQPGDPNVLEEIEPFVPPEVPEPPDPDLEELPAPDDTVQMHR